MGTTCCCTDRQPAAEEVNGDHDKVRTRSVWMQKDSYEITQVEGHHSHTPPVVGQEDETTRVMTWEASPAAEARQPLLQRLNGCWARKEDGKPLCEIYNAAVTWHPTLAYERCEMEAVGVDVLKLVISKHEFAGRVFFAHDGTAAMIFWMDGEIWERTA
mmetsp:Transcript_32372/g.60942  ORF Transcript_32372/g.60942 Transcript_32372/m.60942 type:complete len:159 (-) Transcript_32372:32-508(-)